MIVVESKRKQQENILRKYPNAIIHDVTSNAQDEFVKLSPFYPHGGIPVPLSEGSTAASVEGIWQGLKVFENEDIDWRMFYNTSMRNIKRKVHAHGKIRGHRKGVNGTEILGYVEAKLQIYIPAYKWVLVNKVPELIDRLRNESKINTVVLLDYNTCNDFLSDSQPISHASLIKSYIEGLPPFGNRQTSTRNQPVQLELPFE